MKKEQVLTDTEKQAIEKELSNDHIVEIIPTPTGRIIKRIKKENIISKKPVHK